MASNDQWPPVASASAGKGSNKINGNKRMIKENQQKILETVNEMFCSTLEPAVILSVVQNCNWELQPSIEGLITLAEAVDDPISSVWNDIEQKKENVSSSLSNTSEQTHQNKSPENPLKSQENLCKPQDTNQSQDPIIPPKLEKPKKGGAKNRMGSFCGNIAKLKSSSENSTLSRNNDRSSSNINQKRETSIVPESNNFFNDLSLYGATGRDNLPVTSSPKFRSYGNFPDTSRPMKSKGTNSPSSDKKNKNSPKNRSYQSVQKEKRDNRDDSPEIKDNVAKKQKVASFDRKTNIRKNESESLCGLKVQYRLSGMESSSDDDADVVIEDESSDYKINLDSVISTSVSQFLSPPTQTPPQLTRPEIHMINTPSPPRTPERNVHDATLARIKQSIIQGNKIMIILRGLPGSGKTTLAKSILSTTIGGNPTSHIFSSDDFFVTLGRGVYQFDPTKLCDAHSTNHKRVWHALKDERSPIIVDNTNIEAWEMRPYAAMAVENGYIIEILEPNTPWAQNPKELAEKNTHNVTKSKIRERSQRYERGINGKKLLDMYGLKYSAKNLPPQLRRVPPITVEIMEKKIPSYMADIKSNWDNHQKNVFVLTSHDIESMQNIDESHSGVSINDSNVLSDDTSNSSIVNCPENSMIYGDKVFNDYLQELQDSDDESFELLETSGSEHPSDVSKSMDGKDTTNSQRSDESLKNTVDESVEDFVEGNKDLSPNGSQMTLGAIGSERKGSFAVPTSIGNDEDEKKDNEKKHNIMSQCWDFTLILGRNKLHSRHGTVKLPSQTISMKKDAKIVTDDLSIEGSSIDDTSAVVKKLKDVENVNLVVETEKIIEIVDTARIVEKLNNDEKENLVESKKTFEVVEEIKLAEIATDRVEITDGFPIDEILKDEILVEIDNEANKNAPMKEEIDIEDNEEKIINIPEDTSIVCDILSSVDITDDIVKESMSELEIVEERKKKDSERAPITTFGSIFNMIKTSFLGTVDESSKSIPVKVENVTEPEKFDIDEATNEEKKEENLLNIDTVDSPKLKKLPSAIDEIVQVADNDDFKKTTCDKSDKVFEDLSTNPFREEMIKSRSEKQNSDISSLLTDNINSITWKESPFPLDDAPIPILESHDDLKTVEKTESFTNTTYYDFNVAYVGGTSEPGYRELWGKSRSINEAGTSVTKIDRPPLKLMLDKSSMTRESNILSDEANLSTEKEKISINRLDDLIEMFPDFPHKYLKTFYEQQCNGNFDWAVDVLLLADVPSDFMLENYENKRPSLVNDDGARAAGMNATKLWKRENEKLKQRSHSSSPRTRRSRAKDFRSFSLECVEDRHWPGGEASLNNEETNLKQNEDKDEILETLWAKMIADAQSAKEIADEVAENHEMIEALWAKATEDAELARELKAQQEASSSSTASGQTSEITENEDENEEIMELNFGREFINQLETTFGNPDFAFPDEFKPVMRIKKSMAEELHGLWIQSMYHQMNALHAQLDERMAKDEAMARAVDREEILIPTKEPVVPNLEEIMNMEMALARYKNELKETMARETPNDMASRLTRQMLYESLPDIDQETLSEILKAHGGNFKETCEIIEASIGRTISKSDTLKKQQSLFDRINEERKNRDSQQNSERIVTPVIAVNPLYIRTKRQQSNCKAALARGREARMEAEKHFSLRVENFNKAAEAYRKGYADVAAYYSQMAKLHSENIEAANADAAHEYLSAQMYTVDDEDSLDLHNLFVPEALQAMDSFIDYQLKKLAKSNKRSADLYIITGRGARSNNGMSRIKPAVSKRLISRNIKFEESNPGCLRVTLSKRNSMLD